MTTEATQESTVDYSSGIEFVGFDMPDEPIKKQPEPEEVPETVADSEPEPAPESKPVDDPEVSEAKSRGWTTKQEWIDAGRNPDDWVNAKHFNEKGRLISESRAYRQERGTFENRLQNVKVLYEAQLRTLKNENEQLLQQKKEAVTYGDFDAVQRIDKQLMDNAIEQVSVQQAAQTVVAAPQGPSQEELAKEAAWERDNQWINTQDPTAPEYGKAVFTRNLYQQLLQQYPNSTADERISYVNQTLAQKFPQAPKVNPNRDKPAMTDTKTSTHATNGKLTWADLNGDEIKQWNSFGKDMFKSKDAFLQAVADSRRG